MRGPTRPATMPPVPPANTIIRAGGLSRWLFGLACAFALKARAALWEDPMWGLSGEASLTAGYDSDLFAIDGGPGDSFASFRPSLVLSRKDSLLNLEIEAWNDWTTFLKLTGNDSSDPGFRMKLSYPANIDSMPTQEAEVYWIRTTDANVDVGLRVSRDDALAKYQGDLYDMAKASVAGRISFDRDEYLGAAYTTIETASAGTTLAYALNDLFKAGVGYDVTLGQSEPNSPGLGSLFQREQAITFQAQGEFTPKLTGNVSLGGAQSNYTGSFSHSEWDVVAGADLSWEPRERLVIDLQALRAPSFNANGDIDLISTVGLEVRQELPDGFTARANADAGRTAHERTSIYRTDAIEGAGVGLGYSLTEKLTASAEYDWKRQDSDVSRFTYRQHVVTGQVQYKF